MAALTRKLSGSAEVPDVTAAQVQALGSIGDRRAVPALTAALQDRQLGLDVQVRAAEALGRIGGSAALEPLVGALKDHGEVARAAAVALRQMGAPGVGSALDEYQYTVGLEATEVDALRAEGNLDALAAAVRGHRDPDVRRAAVAAVGSLDDPRAVGLLVEALQNDDWRVGEEAGRALIGLGPDAVQPLIDSLETGRGRFFMTEAARVLGELRDRRSVEPLLAQLESQDSNARMLYQQDAEDAANWIMDALARIGDPRATKPLLAILEGGYVYMHRAEEALRDLRDPESVEPLIGLLGSANFNVREKAARVLGHLSDERAVAPLRRLLDDEEEQVREAAREALERLERT